MTSKNQKCKHKWVDMKDGTLDKLCVKCGYKAMQGQLSISPQPIYTGGIRESNIKWNNGETTIESGFPYKHHSKEMSGITMKEADKQFQKGMKIYNEVWRKLGSCSVNEVGRK